jgi:hypothetical protein
MISATATCSDRQTVKHYKPLPLTRENMETHWICELSR